MTSLTQIAVPFHNAELYVVEHKGQPYTPLRQIVQGMGLDWASQFVKIKQKFESCVVEITMQIMGDDQARSHTCIPVRKLTAWLYSVNPNKVKPELRDTVIKYQEECDDVLWDYWTKGQAVNPRTTKVERTPLHDAHAMLVAKTKHLNSSDAWKLILQRFDVKSIKEIPYEAIPVAVEYVHHLIAMFSNADKMQLAEPWKDQDVQFLMWYVPKIAKLIKNEFYPALTLLRSEYAAQMIGMAQEMACHANILNQAAIKNGMTTYNCLGGQPVHTMKWYLEK